MKIKVNGETHTAIVGWEKTTGLLEVTVEDMESGDEARALFDDAKEVTIIEDNVEIGVYSVIKCVFAGTDEEYKVKVLLQVAKGERDILAEQVEANTENIAQLQADLEYTQVMAGVE